MTRTPFLLAAAGALLLTAGCSKAETAVPATTTTTEAKAVTTVATTVPAESSGSGETTTTAASGSGSGSGSGSSFVDQVAKANLPATVTACLNDKSSSDAAFKAFVETKGTPTLAEATKLMPIVFTCMTKEQFAVVVVASSSTPMSEAGATCVTQLVAGLSTDEIAGLAANESAAMERINPQLVACAKAS